MSTPAPVIVSACLAGIPCRYDGAAKPHPEVVAAVAQAITIVGIVNAVVSLKMIPVTCSPFGKQIVDRNNLAPWDRPLHSI